MVPGIARIVRDRLTVRHVLPLVAFLALVYGITRDVGTLLAIALGMVLVEVIDVLRETPSIDDRWVQVGIGAFVSLGSLAWLAYELTVATDTGGPVWFPGLTFLVGVWFLFDARRDFREGRTREPDDEMGAGEVMLVMNHAHLVVEELKSGPKTVPELAERCDLTESRVREALDVGTEEGVIYRVDDPSSEAARYALDESQVGGVAFVRSNVRRIVRRVARPFRR